MSVVVSPLRLVDEHDTDRRTYASKLTSLGDTFVLNMVNNIRDVVTDVASAAGPSTVPVAKVCILVPS